MFTAINKTIIAATLAVSTLSSGMGATTTAAVVTTTAAVSALASTPAEARTCLRITGQGFANAVFNRAGERRASRRAVRDWESQVANRLGRNFADIGRTRPSCQSFKGQRGQSSFQKCTVTKVVCGG